MKKMGSCYRFYSRVNKKMGLHLNSFVFNMDRSGPQLIITRIHIWHHYFEESWTKNCNFMPECLLLLYIRSILRRIVKIRTGKRPVWSWYNTLSFTYLFDNTSYYYKSLQIDYIILLLCNLLL